MSMKRNLPLSFQDCNQITALHNICLLSLNESTHFYTVSIWWFFFFKINCTSCTLHKEIRFVILEGLVARQKFDYIVNIIMRALNVVLSLAYNAFAHLHIYMSPSSLKQQPKPFKFHTSRNSVAYGLFYQKRSPRLLVGIIKVWSKV